MLTILMGRARTGKSDWILRKIKTLGDGGQQILLVPEHASHAAEMDLCQVCGDTAGRHAEVLSFRRLATRVLSRTGGLADVTLDAGGKLLTLQKALLEVSPALKLYRRPSRKAAFLQDLLDLLDELRSYEVSPERLASLAAEASGTTREKLADLSLLYGACEARLHRPGLDARDRMSKLADHLEESGYVDGKDLFLDGFTYFNGQELRSIGVFLRRAKSVTISLLGEAKGGREEIFAASYRTRDALLCLAEEMGCKAKTLYTSDRPDDGPLTHLEQYFYGETTPWEGASPEGCVRLWEARDAYAEVERTAAEIRRMVASGQYRYRDITVSARNMADYEPSIQSVFQRYEIPVYLSRRSDILETPAMALITGALASVTGGYEYEDIFRYLKTGLAGLSPAECDRLENYALTWDIHGSLWVKEQDWTANPDGYGAPWGERQSGELAELNGLRRRVREPLIFLQGGLKSADTAGGKVETLYSFLEMLRLREALEEQMRRLAQAGQLQCAQETGQLWEILCGVLDQFVEILGDERMDTDEFVRLFRQVVTAYSVGTIPVSLDQVNVSEITRNDRHPVKALFLLGANDHVLPSSGTGGGILNDDDRDELVALGLRLAPRGMERLSMELQNLYAALAQPDCRLTVSYPVADASGGELRPAFVVGRIQALFPGLRVLREDAFPAAAPVPALEAAGDAPGGALWRYFAEKPDAVPRLDAMRKARAMTRGRLSSEGVRRLYGDRFRMSASRMERLNSCHFAYFMEYGLKAKDRGRAEFAAPQIGSFLHFVLENVTRDAKAKGGFSQVDDTELHALTDHYIDLFEEQEYQNFRERSPRFRYLFGRLRSTAWAVVRETAEELRHSDFVPLEFELSFGDDGTLPAVVISEPGGELRVNGKVDRVDGWVKDGRLYLRVVDYKTGRKRFDLAEVRMGLDIQMLLYLFTLQKEGTEHFGRTVEPAGVLYLPARDEVLSAERNISPEELLALRQKTLRRSGLLLNDRTVLQAMEHGALKEPQYLPLRINREGDITAGVASAAQLGRLGRYVDRLLHQIAREVRDGNIDADPCCHSEEDAYCRFCRWAPACHFEDGRDGDHLHYITPVKPEEFWQELEQEEGGNGHG